MKILFYSNTGLTSNQIGLTGEIISELISADHTITFVWCDSVLDNCFFNKSQNPIGCASCQSRQKVVLSLIKTNSIKHVTLKKLIDKKTIEIPKFQNLKELSEYEYQGINIGTGIASSIISHERNFDFENYKYQDLIEVEYKKSINVLANFNRFIEEEKPDSIYIFNGRFSESWPVLNLAKKIGIEYNCIESGAGYNYEIFKNSLPHSIEYRNNEIHRLWKEGHETKKKEIAKNWFTSRRDKTIKNDIVFTKDQEDNLLPPSFDKSKRNIAIMNSSEDELKVIKEWNTGLYSKQNEAILNIVKHFSGNEIIHFILRVHPNLGSVNNSQIEEIRQFDFKNLTVIPPESNVDTYYLMDQCEKVITFGSSTGVESTFWGNVSILYGNSLYMHLDCVYTPKTFNELVHLLNDSLLLPKNKEATFPFGYYMTKYGIKPQLFKFDKTKTSSFNGIKLKKFYFSSFPNLFRYLLKFKHWKNLHTLYFKQKLTFNNFLKYK